MHNIGELLPVWSIIPFVGMLLSIAIIPLVKSHWWEHNMFKVAIFWSLLFLVPFGISFGKEALIYNFLEIVLLDYLPFIVLLFGLFVCCRRNLPKGDFNWDYKDECSIAFNWNFNCQLGWYYRCRHANDSPCY